MMTSCATASWLYAGTLQTVMPLSRAAAMSMLLKPGGEVRAQRGCTCALSAAQCRAGLGEGGAREAQRRLPVPASQIILIDSGILRDSHAAR